MKKIISLAICISLAGVSTGVSAQFGGLPKLPGLGGGSSSSGTVDVDDYLTRSTETAQLMMSSIAILDYARQPSGDKAALNVNRRSIGTPYRRAKGTPLLRWWVVDAGRGFRAAGGVGRA